MDKNNLVTICNSSINLIGYVRESYYQNFKENTRLERFANIEVERYTRKLLDIGIENSTISELIIEALSTNNQKRKIIGNISYKLKNGMVISGLNIVKASC